MKNDFATDADERIACIKDFQPIFVKDHQKKPKETTQSGKSVADAQRSDLYSKTSVPSMAFLARFNSEDFTDEKGRMYWDTNKVEFKWERAQDLREHPGYDEASCSIFFVRPKRGQALTLPDEGSKVSLYPFGASSETEAIVYECIWSGNDEESTDPEKTKQRKTAFVMYKRL